MQAKACWPLLYYLPILPKGGPVKFFLDTADLAEIEEAASWGALAGVTTNPSLYARIGGKLEDFEAITPTGL